ncbi:MAG: AAA family ATPase [Methanosarcinaceae archaeon]|nr:AAA family ATPase [Methanosarcinaceae archaeon]
MTRIPTAIPGLDELIEGGFIENDVILLTGGPGAGKSTFGVQFLYEGIVKYNEPGLYITLEESPARIIRNMWRHNWDLERIIKENKLRIMRANPIAYERYIKDMKPAEGFVDAESATIENILKQIYKQIQEIGAKRLFIDSITSLKISSDPATERHMILEFIKNIENFDCTTLITSEIHSVPESFSVEEYLSEGVIRLHVFRVGGNRVRGIEILKMRGVKHDEVMHPYAITDEGIVVYPSETVIGKDTDILKPGFF